MSEVHVQDDLLQVVECSSLNIPPSSGSGSGLGGQRTEDSLGH